MPMSGRHLLSHFYRVIAGAPAAANSLLAAFTRHYYEARADALYQ